MHSEYTEFLSYNPILHSIPQQCFLTQQYLELRVLKVDQSLPDLTVPDSNTSIIKERNAVYRLTTIADMALMRNKDNDLVYQRKGLLTYSNQNIHDIHYILYRLLLNPNAELCALINQYISSLSSSFVIGIQLRVGGKMRNRMDHIFKDSNAVNQTINSLKERINALSEERNVTVFVSTDSDSTLALLQKSLFPIPVIYVKEYVIAHSASIHAHYNYTEWIGATKRAIVDMMILKECDYLVVTSYSSFGGTAIDLQQSYSVDVSVDSVLRQSGLRCSVFHRKKPLGNYIIL